METMINEDIRENVSLTDELDGLRQDRKERDKEIKCYNSSIADNLMNGNMGKEIDEFVKIEKDYMVNPKKYKKNFLKRFFDNLFRTI